METNNLKDALIYEILKIEGASDIKTLEKMNVVQLTFILDHVKKYNCEIK